MADPQKSAGKSPRFLCESCGAEVPMNAGTCPKCGMDFESIRCPACGFTGGVSVFRGGCPSCGKSAVNSPQNAPKRKKTETALPLWVYILSAAIFTGGLAALFLRLIR